MDLCSIPLLKCHELLLQNPVSTFIILLLILLSNDVELNPGPTKEGELSIFHLNTRSMRHKFLKKKRNEKKTNKQKT
jgi:hypothetical protein